MSNIRELLDKVEELAKDYMLTPDKDTAYVDMVNVNIRLTGVYASKFRMLKLVQKTVTTDKVKEIFGWSDTAFISMIFEEGLSATFKRTTDLLLTLFENHEDIKGSLDGKQE